MGLFLCVAGIVVMLGDLLAHGEARVCLDHLSGSEDDAGIEDDQQPERSADGGSLSARHGWWACEGRAEER